MIRLFVDKTTGSPAGVLNIHDIVAAYRQVVLPALLLLLTNAITYVSAIPMNTLVVKGIDLTAVAIFALTFFLRLLFQKLSDNTQVG
ncbi:MAG: hypothetical protein C5B59_12785 [Bacteroidetes bacterium]|nr:MAG: hypothetical protein C5B59_12785 [Bacteroidota bacterium]